MKKIIPILALLLLPGYSQAQSGGVSKGQTGASPVNYSRKANTSQIQGKGVPYSKDKEQRNSATAKGGTPSATGSNAANASRRGTKSSNKAKSGRTQ